MTEGKVAWPGATTGIIRGAMTGSVVIRAGRLLDVVRGQTLLDRELVIEGDRIAAVRQVGPLGPQDRVIDLSDHTVLPGLIDCHTHLVGDVQISGIPSIQMSAAQETLLG